MSISYIVLTVSRHNLVFLLIAWTFGALLAVSLVKLWCGKPLGHKPFSLFTGQLNLHRSTALYSCLACNQRSVCGTTCLLFHPFSSQMIYWSLLLYHKLRSVVLKPNKCTTEPCLITTPLLWPFSLASHADILLGRHTIFGEERLRDEPKECLRGRLPFLMLHTN